MTDTESASPVVLSEAVTGGCAWPVSYSACGACDALADPDTRTMFEQIAADYLRAWTGGAYGLCPVVLRPCRAGCGTSRSATFWGAGPPWQPVLINGAWVNVTCGCPSSGCTCGDNPTMLRLPGPISGPVLVTIDGSPLLPTAYRVDNARILQRTDGGAWPTCQDYSLDVDKPGTWQVEYSRGTPVPMGGQVAAGILACELAKAACSDKSCALPQRVQSITRQGVTIAVLDSFDDVQEGRTGIWLIDSWVASVTQPRRGGSVRSVDLPRDRNRTKTWPTT